MININGPFSQWDSVAMQYRDYTNDVVDRNAPGYGELVYTNTTGRNDFDVMKVAYDAENVYFYVTTVDAISQPAKENWMTLYLSIPKLAKNSDSPNWENYHFAINRIAAEAKNQAVVERSKGGWNWEKKATIDMKVEGNQMQIAVPRRLLGLENGPVHLQFKWADNCPAEGKMDSFYIDGDVAPIGRLNYVFAE